MTLSSLDASDPGVSAVFRSPRALFWVRAWLIAVAVMVFAMVIVGGATRLTESGLSIVEWQPILGALPPLSDAAWAEAFDKYRQIPQYKLVNAGMSLDAFKFIFWWEWSHRLLGRVIGLAFALPLLVFVALRWLTPGLLWRALGLLALGGLQGAIGWWMVVSGLAGRTDVAPYRLATHLTLASVILAALVWTAASLWREQGRVGLAPAVRPHGASTVFALGLVVAVLVQIYLGGLVAGNDAGLVFNTWPDMGGRFVPDGAWALEPGWKNLFENHATVQFVHRLGAYGLVALVVGYALSVRHAGDPALKRLAVLLLVIVTAQALIGIITLLLAVPLSWALLHQGGAMVLLAAASVTLATARRPIASRDSPISPV